MGFDAPTPIQEQAIPSILQNKDLIACAQTGTGKTAAFLLPVLHKLIDRKSEKLDTIVIVPTRELALQIDQQLEGFRYFTGGTSIAVYGGGEAVDFEKQKKAIISGVDIIIVTPGRFLSHLNLGYVPCDSVRHVILDEADRMLDMGFFEDIMRIFKFLPKEKQTLLFSATMPKEIRKLASKLLVDPEEVNIAVSKPAEGVLQGAYLVYDDDKTELTKHLLTNKDLPSVLIFCSTKSAVKSLEVELSKLKFDVKAIHSDLEQGEREKVMLSFRNRNCQILVATDIVSRGID
ncbi:MAG: DEAD/DEAH box helicase, partial [Bacteroidia bacterium]|nr:DEAD/DEAH box helicase [Bacteroidia bacterium]